MSTYSPQKEVRVVTIGVGGPPLDPTHLDYTWPATLVQFDRAYFLVDCGGGTTHGLLRAGIHPSQIKNLLFTHHHADHNSDYFTFAIGGWNGPNGRRELNLVGPAQTRQLHRIMLDFYWGDLEYRMRHGFPGEGMVRNVSIREVTGGDSFVLDGVSVSVAEGPHTMGQSKIPGKHHLRCE